MSDMYERRYVHLLSGTNATNCLPTDGNGGKVEQRGAARNISAISGNTATLNSAASIVATDTVITTDGFWGVVTGVSSNDVTVAEWIYYGGKISGKVPATGTANLFAFPVGCGLLGHRRVRVETLYIPKAVTAVGTVSILDFRMAAATPIFTHNTVSGQPMQFDLRLPCRGPFAVVVSDYANLTASVAYTPLS